MLSQDCLKPALQHCQGKQVLHLLFLPQLSPERGSFHARPHSTTSCSLLIDAEREDNPPCVPVGLGPAYGPWGSQVYLWIFLTGSTGISGTSPRMSLRRTGRRWPRAALARCTGSSSKAGRKNASSNAFPRPPAPKARTGRWVPRCDLPF